MKSILLSAAFVAALSMVSCGGNSAATDAAADSTGVVAADEITFVGDGVIELAAGDSISTAPELPTFVDFNAVWCGPCQQFKPVFEQVAKDFAGKAQFISVNVDSCPDVAKAFGVSPIPQISVIMPNGDTDKAIGAMSLEQFTAMVKAALGEE